MNRLEVRSYPACRAPHEEMVREGCGCRPPLRDRVVSARAPQRFSRAERASPFSKWTEEFAPQPQRDIFGQALTETLHEQEPSKAVVDAGWVDEEARGRRSPDGREQEQADVGGGAVICPVLARVRRGA